MRLATILGRFSKSKGIALGMSVFSLLMTATIIRELIIKMAIFPVQRGLMFPFVQFALLSGILYVSYRNIWIKTSIISMFAFLLSLINSVIMWMHYQFAPFYIRTVISQPAFIEYTYEGAIRSYKLLIYICFIIACIVWLRYILIIRHNLLEQ